MAGDYVPHNDNEFVAWALAWQAYATAHTAEIGLTAADLTALTDKVTACQAALAAHTNAQNAALGARQTKDTTRDDLESWLRTASQRVQVHPGTSDANRAGLGITVHDVLPTAGPTGDTRPLPAVKAGQRLRHEIRWRDEASGRRAKPVGVTGCEVWVKVGAPPVDPSECRFVGLDTRSSLVAEYNGEDGGKMAHYMLRWVGNKGQKGPWSETASATIQN